jgi:hypothetical protein
MLEAGQVVVVLDGLGAHKTTKVSELVEERKAELVFLPPYYSPDLKWDEKAEVTPVGACDGEPRVP